MVTFGPARTTADLQAILDLQQLNLPKNISTQEALEQGFLTVEHDLDTLAAMNDPYGHAIGKEGEQLAGYALAMTRDYEDRITILAHFFALLDTLHWQGQSLQNIDYILMGQVCVAKEFRGQGVFGGLYRDLQVRMAPHFAVIVTEISERNTRSLRAHEKVGFEVIHEYRADDGEGWIVVALPTLSE